MRALRAGIVCGVAVLGLAADARAGAWDQARVTELAGQLDASVRELLADPGIDARQPSAVQERRHHSAIVSIREFARRASDLAEMLRAGRGFDQTRAIWEQMMMVRDDVRYYAEESSLPESVNAKAQRAGELIEEIAPFYVEG